MKRTYFKMLLACQLFTCTAVTLFAQNLQGDTDMRQSVFDNSVASYLTANTDQSRLYNGPEYHFYDALIKGNAYFTDVNNFTPGAVEYDGFVYKNVPMLYDIYKDCVVLLLPNKTAKISLLSERVQNFDWMGHHFVYLTASDAGDSNRLSAGFYDQLYKGKTEVLVKHTKNLQSAPGSGPITETAFNPKKEIFVKQNGTYRCVSNEDDLLNIFKDKKKELKHFISANNVATNVDTDRAMVKIAAYYDELSR